jgi:superfamily I DNA/RNA helicase
LIAVGDECQSIYGFRGAHGQAMAEGQARFNMTPLVLSISFRCPQSIVHEARWRAPHMQWPEWAKEGSVTKLGNWGPQDLPNTATILCRNNAPIFSMAINLLKAGRFPQVVGANDIGTNLIKVLKKLGPPGMKQEMVLAAIRDWQKEKLKKARNERKVQDQADCLVIFAEQGPTLGDALVYAEHLMTAKGPILLMTGHKAKGLEFDDVFILDRHLVRMEEEQDRNLMYVMQTRSKSSLTYVTSDGWEEDVHTKPSLAYTPASEFADEIPF